MRRLALLLAASVALAACGGGPDVGYRPAPQLLRPGQIDIAPRPRLGLECGVELGIQTDFSEPLIRVNTDLLDTGAYGWSETDAWDALAAHYAEL